MKEKLVSYLTYGNRFYSVEQTQHKGEKIYNGIELRKKKNEVDIEKRFQFNNLEEALNFIPKGKPSFLVINNEHVITKKVESNELESSKLVHNAFPNIKLDDFYYEILKQDTIHFIAICRKSYLDELLNEYKSKHISIIDFSLGNLMIASLSSLISEDEIYTSNALVTKVENQISTIQIEQNLTNSTYNFHETSLSNNELLNFSAALSLITKTKALESVFSDRSYNLKRNFKEKLFFTQFIKIGLSALFITLLINFFVFNSYYDKVNELKETALVLNTSKNKVVSLNNKVLKAQKMVEDVLKSNASKSSFYANALINSLPESIILSELNYQPLLKKIKENKPIENESNSIIVSGSSSQSVLFSQWVSQLEDLKWINTIEIISFEDSSRISSLFTIKILIQDDTKN